MQLTAVLPFETKHPSGRPSVRGLSNIELAAKIKFVEDKASGLGVVAFPRLLLPSASDIGEAHVRLLLPLWAGYSFGK